MPMKARPISSTEKKDDKVHTTTRSKRPLAAAEEDAPSSIMIFDENLRDRPTAKKRRNSMIPMKATHKANDVLSDKINILADSGEITDTSKHLIPLEKKKPITRRTRMSLASSRGASENVSSEAPPDVPITQMEETTDSVPRRITRSSRQSMAVVTGTRRLMGRDL